MLHNNNQIYPWFTTDTRNILKKLNESVSEESIGYLVNDNSIPMSPVSIAVSVSEVSMTHYRQILDTCLKSKIRFDKIQSEKIHIELIALNYFNVVLLIAKYLKDDQLKLFISRIQVAILDKYKGAKIFRWLISSKKIEEEDKKIQDIILNSGKFYFENKTNDEISTNIQDDISLFLNNKDEYENNFLTQLAVKNYNRISIILNIRSKGDIFLQMSLFNTNESIINTANEVYSHIRPVWHLESDNKIIKDYGMVDQK